MTILYGFLLVWGGAMFGVFTMAILAASKKGDQFYELHNRIKGLEDFADELTTKIVNLEAEKKDLLYTNQHQQTVIKELMEVREVVNG